MSSSRCAREIFMSRRLVGHLRRSLVCGACQLGSIAALEHAAAAAWGAIGERLRGDARAYAETIGGREERHAERVSGLIRELGGEPPEGRPQEEYAASFPLMRTEGEALRFASDLEEKL